MNDKFGGSIVPTIGVAFNTKQVWKDSGLVNLEIWDTAGKRNFFKAIKKFLHTS